MAENVLASDKALYKGHAIAVVAAESPHIAEEALDLIQVDYEVLTPILDVREAMREDAPLLLDNMTTRFRVERMGMGEDTGVKSNIADHVQFKRGDLEQGFKEADVIVVEGNPLDDLRDLERVQMTFVRGSCLYSRPPVSAEAA